MAKKSKGTENENKNPAATNDAGDQTDAPKGKKQKKTY